MAQTTPKYALPWPDTTDPADGSKNIGDLAKKVDDVIFTTIFTPIDNRLKVLEAKPAAPPAPTTQNGEWTLNGTISLPAATWTLLQSTPSLAIGTWLIMAQVQVLATDNTNPGHTTCHVVAASAGTKSSGGSFPDDRAGQTQIALQMIAVLSVAQAVRLEAYNNQGKSQVVPTSPNPDGNTATRLAWIKLA